jgi:hypothetical protein
MADPQIEVEGLAEFVRDLKRAGDKDAEVELKRAHRDAADVVAKAARPMVPTSSGALLGTLRTAATLKSGRVALGKKAVPYANPIHWGWLRRHITPNPFLLDAFDARRAEVLDTFERSVERLVDSIGS